MRTSWPSELLHSTPSAREPPRPHVDGVPLLSSQDILRIELRKVCQQRTMLRKFVCVTFLCETIPLYGVIMTTTRTLALVNTFARRQTAESKFSHFGGSEDQLLELVEACMEQAKAGYRDGVILVPVPPENFFSGVVEVSTDTPLRAEFGARAKSEAPYINVVAAGGEKLPAAAVEVVLYRHDVLGADATRNEAGEPVAEWEIISLNARATEGPEPMSPMAMARNFLALEGGTKAEYTAEEFARAIVYWSTRAMRG